MSRAAPIPGHVRRLGEVPAPLAYAVFDCETTGTDPEVDEIVSLALLRLDPAGNETRRFSSLVWAACPIPAEATAVNGLRDADVATAPRFAEIVDELLALLDGAVFVAHNAAFDLAMLRKAFAREGVDYLPAGIACTLTAFRLLEPLEPTHRLDATCARYGIDLVEAHEALADVLATADLLRVLLHRHGIAPETADLDHPAFMRLRAAGDMRPASEPQIRRVYGLARTAGLVGEDGDVDRAAVVSLVERIVGTQEVDALTRAQVQDVYDELGRLAARLAEAA